LVISRDYNKRRPSCTTIRNKSWIVFGRSPLLLSKEQRNEETEIKSSFVGLFVDISGFTQFMETLMQHGQHGAEVMASVMLGFPRKRFKRWKR
jgi:hypothetical protein